MTTLTAQEKYAQPEVVGFWKQLSQHGLQECEQAMISRYLPPQGRLLDLGCGAGRALLALEQAGFHVAGIDLSRSMLAAGRSLSAEARLSGANVLDLPFSDGVFDALFMFFGALQHIQGRGQRRQALAEMARVTRPEGRLILGVDNVAPALICYGYWLGQKLGLASQAVARSRIAGAVDINGVDSTLWSRHRRQIHPLRWHLRGLARTLRWRTWPGLIDVGRRLNPRPDGLEPGDTLVAQFAVPSTPGRIYYHLYRVAELIEDAGGAGWRPLGQHSGSELTEGRIYPEAVRQRDKQLFVAFERG